MPGFLASENAFTWLMLLPLVKDHPELSPFFLSLLAVAVLLGLAALARLALPSPDMYASAESLLPDGKLTARNFFELFADALLNMCRRNLGHDAERFFPLIAGVFAYILFCNLLGLIPGFSPPTSNINTNIGMALSIFVIYNATGLVRNGFGYIKHLWGPVMWLGPLMFVVEVIGHLARPVSLSIRLYGNMFGDHTVLDIFLNQLPNATFKVLAFGLPVVFLALGVFVSLVQAFVFSLLSTVYISLAAAHEEHH